MGNSPSLVNGAGSCVLFQPITLEINANACNYNTVYNELYKQLSKTGCQGNTLRELYFLTGTKTYNEAYAAIKGMCEDAYAEPFEDFSIIDGRFDYGFMQEFIGGGTFLNGKQPIGS